MLAREHLKRFMVNGRFDRLAADAAMIAEGYACVDESCDAPLHWNKGDESRRPHFVHPKRKACGYDSAGMTESHALVQVALQRALRTTHGSTMVVKLEDWTEAASGIGRADVMVRNSRGEALLCIEVQLSSMSSSSKQAREEQRQESAKALEWVFLFQSGVDLSLNHVNVSGSMREVLDDRGYFLTVDDPLAEEVRLKVVVHRDFAPRVGIQRPRPNHAGLLNASWALAGLEATERGLFHPTIHPLLDKWMSNTRRKRDTPTEARAGVPAETISQTRDGGHRWHQVAAEAQAQLSHATSELARTRTEHDAALRTSRDAESRERQVALELDRLPSGLFSRIWPTIVRQRAKHSETLARAREQASSARQAAADAAQEHERAISTFQRCRQVSHEAAQFRDLEIGQSLVDNVARGHPAARDSRRLTQEHRTSDSQTALALWKTRLPKGERPNG